MTEENFQIQSEKSDNSSEKMSRGHGPFETIDDLFRRYYPEDWFNPLRKGLPAWYELQNAISSRVPRVDVIERDQDIVVRAELPGVEKSNIEISLTENTVTIKGHKPQAAKEEKEGEYYRCEISRGPLSRTVDLPCQVNADNSSATFKDGLLQITLPKLKQSKRQSINIQ